MRRKAMASATDGDVFFICRQSGTPLPLGSKPAFCGTAYSAGQRKTLDRRLLAAVVAQERNAVVFGKKIEHLGHRVQ
jgi:hypothetical protein